MYPHSLRLLLVTTIALVGAVAPSVSWADASQSGATQRRSRSTPPTGIADVSWRGADGHPLRDVVVRQLARSARDGAADSRLDAVGRRDDGRRSARLLAWNRRQHRRGAATSALGDGPAPARVGNRGLRRRTRPSIRPNDDEYVFWRGTDGSIYEAWWNGGLAWAAADGVGICCIGPGRCRHHGGSSVRVLAGTRRASPRGVDYGGWSGPRDLTSANHWSAASTLASAPGAAVNPRQRPPVCVLARR